MFVSLQIFLTGTLKPHWVDNGGGIGQVRNFHGRGSCSGLRDLYVRKGHMPRCIEDSRADAYVQARVYGIHGFGSDASGITCMNGFTCRKGFDCFRSC